MSALSLTLRSIAAHERDHKGHVELAGIIDAAAAEIERLLAARLPDREGWQPIETIPQDGEAYLADCGRVQGGFPQVVYWDDGRLHVPDAGISYVPAFFTHWKRIDQAPQVGDVEQGTKESDK